MHVPSLGLSDAVLVKPKPKPIPTPVADPPASESSVPKSTAPTQGAKGPVLSVSEELAVYLLGCIDPQLPRQTEEPRGGWLSIINFMKFSSELKDAKEITRMWSKGDMHGIEVNNTDIYQGKFSDALFDKDWNGLNDQGFDINILHIIFFFNYFRLFL